MESAIVEGKCVMCLQSVETRVEVRKLPCNHVCCSQCLNEVRTVKCPTCRTDHGKFDAETFEIVSQQYGCGHNDCWRIAGSYCTKCCGLFCDEHLKAHSNLLKNHTKMVISLAHYKMDRQKLTPRACAVEGHEDETVRLACIHCKQPMCEKCVHATSACAEHDAGHTAKLAEVLAEDHKKKLYGQARRFAEHERRMEELAKEAMQYEAEYSEQNKKMISEVNTRIEEIKRRFDQKSEQFTQLIKARSDRHNQQNYRYQRDATALMRRFEKGQLEMNDLSHRHVLDNLQRPEFREELNQLQDVQLPNLIKPDKFCIINTESALKNDAPFKLVSTPEHMLTFSRELEYDCRSSVHVGNALITGGKHCELSGLAKQSERIGTVISLTVDEYNPTHIYLIIHAVGEASLYKINALTCQTDEVATFPDYGTECIYCVSSTFNYIAVTDERAGLKIYSKNDFSRLKRVTIDWVRSFCTKIAHRRDNTVVVSNPEAGKLIAMNLENEEVIWELRELKGPQAITINREDGYILTAEIQRGHIYIISFEGELLTTLKFPEPNRLTGILDISYNRGEFTVVDRSLKVKVYQLNPQLL